MRIWSLHPKYLDTKGLIALWRETLLARNVLEGKTKGYKLHPQLIRFSKADFPIEAINQYLHEVYREAKSRGFNFNREKLRPVSQTTIINVTQGQMVYEGEHLSGKLKIRDQEKLREFMEAKEMDPHPLFRIVDGDVESWEVISNRT